MLFLAGDRPVFLKTVQRRPFHVAAKQVFTYGFEMEAMFNALQDPFRVSGVILLTSVRVINGPTGCIHWMKSIRYGSGGCVQRGLCSILVVQPTRKPPDSDRSKLTADF
jgi:hypothetical protein